MASDTVIELLIAQSDRKLSKMRVGIMDEIKRLSLELQMVDEAVKRKHARTAVADETAVTGRSTITASETIVNGGDRKGDGRFEGLSRFELLQYVREIGRPVKPKEMRNFLAAKGIDRKIDAVRVGLIRLERDGSLVRTDDGGFAVPGSNGNGAGVTAEHPLFRDSTVEAEN